MTSSSRHRPPGTRLGPYEIVALLGAGGMGEVYRARDTRLRRDVAIKVLPVQFSADPERLRRFEHEARAVAALDHPNILAIHDVGTHEGSPFIVTELLEGETLRERLDGEGLTARKAVEIGIQIAKGLTAAHEKGIVHRDLKPANVFVTMDGRVKILDFGIAKLAESRNAEEIARATTVMEATGAGAAVGTVGYISPEQLRGQSVDHRTDMFSFGCVLYEMLSGERAFRGDTTSDVTAAILKEDPAPLPASVPLALQGIVSRCLEKRPDGRFSSAHDLALALEATATATSGRQVIPGMRRWPRTGGALAAIAMVAAAVAALSVFLAHRSRHVPLPEFHPMRVVGHLGTASEPAISPSGSEIAYTGTGHGTSDIWVVDVRGGKPIRLTDGPSLSFGPAWFPDGSTILFSSDSGKGISVWRVPRFGGTAMLLVANAQDASISPDGAMVAFARPGKDSYLRIWVAPVSAPEQARKLTGDGAGLWDHRNPAWSPDGATICYQDVRDLWLVPATGGGPRPFTHDDTRDSHPRWSADGRHIYFASDRGGTRSLWRKATAGGAPVRVTHGAGLEESPTTSRDGRRLAFLSGIETWTVALADVATGRVNRLEHGRQTAFPALAPGGGAIVFVSTLMGKYDLWSQQLRGNEPVGEPARLTDLPGTCAAPAFSPDGQWIACFRVVDGQRDVWIIPAQGGTPVNFSAHPAVDIEPAWSPDSHQVAFVSNRGGWHQIWTAPFADGHRVGEPRQVTREEGNASYPCWSPDGRTIAYVLSTDAGSEIHLTMADGMGPPRTLTAGAQAYMVRWWWAKNALLVSGFWGQRLPEIRFVPPGGGPTTRLEVPPQVAPDMRFPEFALSSDGALLALFQSARQDEIWVLEAQEGSF